MASTLLVANTFSGNAADNTSLRFYGTTVSNAFANSGWVKTGDAGQINWGTVVANSTTNFTYGYEMWCMNDALQNAAPTFLKVTYKNGVVATEPAFSFQLGSSTDTLGNLTGVPSATITMYGNGPAAVSPCYFVGAPSRLVMMLWTTTAGGVPLFFSVERTHDAGGNDTTDGVMMTAWGYNNGSLGNQLYWSYAGTPAGTTENMGVFAATATMTPSVMQVYPQYYCNGLFTNPSLNVLWAVNLTITPYAPISVSFYGATRRYLPTLSLAYNTLRVGNITIYPMILWE